MDPDPFDWDPDPDPAFHFDTDLGPAFQFDTVWFRLFDSDPDPCHFKEVMYLKHYIFNILT